MPVQHLHGFIQACTRDEPSDAERGSGHVTRDDPRRAQAGAARQDVAVSRVDARADGTHPRRIHRRAPPHRQCCSALSVTRQILHARFPGRARCSTCRLRPEPSYGGCNEVACNCLPQRPCPSIHPSKSVAATPLACSTSTSRSLTTDTTLPGRRGGKLPDHGAVEAVAGGDGWRAARWRGRRWQCFSPWRTRRPGR